MQPDYTFYTGEYKGNKISDADFPRLLVKATIKLNHYEQIWDVTFYPFPEKPDDYMRNMALCALCEEIQVTDKANDVTGENGIVRSVSFSSASTSFDGITAERAIETAEGRCEAAVKEYAHIYKGVRRTCR